MSNNKKLFADAIADAKALREVAVANAKAALEESFMPRIQSMFEKRIMDDEKLKEEEELEEKATYIVDKDNLLKSLDEKKKMKKDEMEEGYGAYEYEKGKEAGEMNEEDDLEEDIDLEELFRSLEEDDDSDPVMEMDSELEEGEEELEEEYDLEEILRELEEESNLEEGEDEDDDLNENYFEEAAEGNEDISEVTVDELRDMIQDAIKAVMGDQGGEETDTMDMDMDMDVEDGGEEVDLGIEDEEETEEKPKKKSKKDELDELYALYERKKKEVEKELDERKKYKGSDDKEDNLDESKKDLNAPFGKVSIKHKDKIGAPYGAPGKKSGLNGAYDKKLAMKLNEKAKAELEEVEDETNEAKKVEKELEEAVRVIKALRGQLNEVNLLNAKLIYVNRIFKANTLTESQKVNVVNSFDKAQTLNEAKNIYEVLKNTVKTSSKVAKAPLRENKSFASSIIGGTTAKSPVIDTNDQITRMQKLAGIIKN